MLIGVNPAETVWKSWSEIQRERIRIERAVLVQRRAQMAERLAAAKIEGNAAAAALQPLDAMLTKLDAEAAALQPIEGEPEFQIGHISWKARGRVQALYAANKIEDAGAAMELLVRHGCRGHRGLKTGAGSDVAFSFESSKGNFPVLDEATFEAYAASGVVEALASVILDYNTLGKDREKN